MHDYRKIHIAVIQQTPDMGGAETYMYSLMKAFKKEGHQVELATNLEKFSKYSRNIGIKVVRVPMVLDIIGNYRGLVKSCLHLPYAIYFYSSLLYDYRKRNVDVILMSGFSEKLLVTFLSIFFRLPVVWIEYGRLNSVIKRNFYIPYILYRSLNRFTKKIITASSYTRQSLVNEILIPEARIIVIPCGIEVPKLVTNKFNRNGAVIGCVSRLTREKGQQMLIRAMPIILRKIPDAQLILIGQGPDKAYFESLIQKMKLEKNIKLLGYVENLSEYYSKMDIFVFPTVWELEGFGLVSIEAMAHKLPVVATRLGPVPEIVKNSITGILVPPNDIETLADSIIKLLKDSNLRKIMGNKGRELVKKEYTLKVSSNRILDLFYKVL